MLISTVLEFESCSNSNTLALDTEAALAYSL